MFLYLFTRPPKSFTDPTKTCFLSFLGLRLLALARCVLLFALVFWGICEHAWGWLMAGVLCCGAEFWGEMGGGSELDVFCARACI
jgi:hypothetical protein